MPADVEEAAHAAVLSPDHEEGNTGEIVRQEVTRLRNLAAEPHEEGVAAEQRLPLGRKLRPAGVVGHRVPVLRVRHRRRLGLEVVKELPQLGHLVALVHGREALHVHPFPQLFPLLAWTTPSIADSRWNSSGC